MHILSRSPDGVIHGWDDAGSIPEGHIPLNDLEIADFIAGQDSPASMADAERARIVRELEAVDLATVRPLRAIAAGSANAEDYERLAELDAQAAALRAELAALPA